MKADKAKESAVEKILGPIDGLYIAVYVRDLGRLGTSFLGHYKICRKAPKDFQSAEFLRSKCVEGMSGTAEEAQDIAIQLARLQIACLQSRRKLSPAAQSVSSLSPYSQASRAYAATVAAPL